MIPPQAHLLLAWSILPTLVASHVLPRQTELIEARNILNVVPWPILATPAPGSPHQRLRRQSNTVCGYIGGDPNLPATCLAGSHCAVDVEVGALGCCPDEGPCKKGIFTGCVDGNSGPQTIADPYIFTCRDRNVCYKNEFEGGFFQYGCGTASNLATKVAASASGKPRLTLASISIKLTATSTLMSSPTTLSASTTETSGTSSTSSAGPSSLAATSHSLTDGAAAPGSDESHSKNTAAIVGGVLGGLSFVVASVILFLFLWRRRSKENSKIPADGQYPKYSRQEITEAGPSTNRKFDRASAESGVLGYTVQQPHRFGTDKEGMARGGDHSGESDRGLLAGDLNEHRFDWLSDREGPESNTTNQSQRPYPLPRRGDGNGALWQQNRRRSRNLVWM